MKKMILIFVGVIVVLIIAVVMMAVMGSRPITKEEAVSSIQALLEKEVKKNKHVTSGLVLIDSKKHDIRESFAEGTVYGKGIETNQPFHVASVGKSFTAVLIGILIDEGVLTLDDPINLYLDEALLKDLFVIDGVDYSHDVTVSMLMNHTSGVADYFEDQVVKNQDEIQGTTITEFIIINPDKLWTPLDLLDFSRRYQEPVGKPKEKYHYSDTGYILLGLIIEAAGKDSFDHLLETKIFEPLEMNDSYLNLYSKPKNEIRPIAEVWLDGVDISKENAASIDWAGGGIVSTLDDLALFIRGIHQDTIIKKDTLLSLYQFDEKFMTGIHYGYGFMEYHFEEFFPTLSALPKMRGHMGILGTQMLYDEATDTVYISSFGSTDYSAGSVKTLIKVLSFILRIKD